MTQAWMVLEDFAKDFDTGTAAARAMNLNYQSFKDCIRRQAPTVQQSTIDRIRTVQPHLADQLQVCLYDPKQRVYKVGCHPATCSHFPTCQRLQSDGDPVLCEKED